MLFEFPHPTDESEVTSSDSLVMLLVVDRFASANAFEYFECEKTGCLQTHGCIETCAPLLDHREMECGGVGDRLNLIVGVAVMQWNAGPVYDVDDLRKRVAEIGIARASITRVPTCVHIE